MISRHLRIVLLFAATLPLGPPGMRADTVRALNAALVKAVNMPDFRERFAKSGVTVAPSTPQELAKIQAEELKQWAEPVRASGFKENG